MNYSIRPWIEADRADASKIHAALNPTYASDPAGWHLASQIDHREDQPQRLVATSDSTNEIIGYAAIRYVRSANARVDLMVHPEWHRRGIGSNLINNMLRYGASIGVTKAHVRARWDSAASLCFLQHHGFTETHRMHGLRIRLSDLDVVRCTQLKERLATDGISVTKLAIEDWPSSTIDRLLELYNAVKPGWVNPEDLPSVPTPRAQFMELLEGRLSTYPEVPLFLATQSERYVGFCGIRALGTAVHPECRRSGIATGLKAVALLDAGDRGETTAFTCTANPVMMAINERFGYVRESVEVRLWKSLATGS